MDMSWTELLRRELDSTYKITDNLIAMVDDDALDWKPSTENNWMTTGQVLRHIVESCGLAFKGFVAGDWSMPEGVDMSDLEPDEMLPPAEKLPTVGSVAEARKMLADDKKLALEMLGKCSEEDLQTRDAPAPWDPSDKMILGHRLLEMVSHVDHHKMQLFLYLKLQGKPVNTGHLWGA
jgi:hypothetical protein